MEKISSPRERRKWGLGLAQHLKGASPNLLTESHYPGNKKTQPWVSLVPSLKVANLGNNFFYG